MTVDLDAPIFLLGMPRSGTTWLSQVFESSPDVVVRLSPPYSYDFRGSLAAGSDAAGWREVLGGSVASDDRFLTQNWRRDSGELPEFADDKADASRLAIKDTRFHDLYESGMAALPAARMIYIVRHPGASLWSWRMCKEFPADADFGEQWRSGQCRKQDGPGEYWGFDDWLALTQAYYERAAADPQRYLVVRYEQMVRDALGTAERMLAFSGLRLHPATAEFVLASQASFDPRPYSVFKGNELRQDWRTQMPAEILDEVERETAAAGLGELLS